MKRELSPSQMLDMRKFGFSPAYVAREAGISEGYVSRLAPLHKRKDKHPLDLPKSEPIMAQVIGQWANALNTPQPPKPTRWKKFKQFKQWLRRKQILNWN